VIPQDEYQATAPARRLPRIRHETGKANECETRGIRRPHRRSNAAIPAEAERPRLAATDRDQHQPPGNIVARGPRLMWLRRETERWRRDGKEKTPVRAPRIAGPTSTHRQKPCAARALIEKLEPPAHGRETDQATGWRPA